MAPFHTHHPRNTEAPSAPPQVVQDAKGKPKDWSIVIYVAVVIVGVGALCAILWWCIRVHRRKQKGKEVDIEMNRVNRTWWNVDYFNMWGKADEVLEPTRPFDAKYKDRWLTSKNTGRPDALQLPTAPPPAVTRRPVSNLAPLVIPPTSNTQPGLPPLVISPVNYGPWSPPKPWSRPGVPIPAVFESLWGAELPAFLASAREAFESGERRWGHFKCGDLRNDPRVKKQLWDYLAKLKAAEEDDALYERDGHNLDALHSTKKRRSSDRKSRDKKSRDSRSGPSRKHGSPTGSPGSSSSRRSPRRSQHDSSVKSRRKEGTATRLLNGFLRNGVSATIKSELRRKFDYSGGDDSSSRHSQSRSSRSHHSRSRPDSEAGLTYRQSRNR